MRPSSAFWPALHPPGGRPTGRPAHPGTGWLPICDSLFAMRRAWGSRHPGRHFHTPWLYQYPVEPYL